jgi:galactonate dehydratase
MHNAILLRRARLAARSQFVGPARSSDVIRQVTWYRLREPVSGRSYTVLRIATAQGLVGYGECGPIEARQAQAAVEAIIGRDPSAYEVIRTRLAAFPAVNAAVNIALLDILGQRVRVPIYQFLGGPTRNKVRAMATLQGETEDELKRAAESALQTGYRILSVPLPAIRAPNQGQAFVLAVRRRLEALRAAAGPGVDFVLDAAARLTPGDAASVAAALEGFHLLWLDEPCPLVSLGPLRKISQETVTPVGYGRSLCEASRFQDLLREGLIDVLRPDIALNGISPIRRMAAIAETYYVAIAPFHNGGPIGTAAALHLAASLPNFFVQQAPLARDPRDRAVRTALASGWSETPQNGFFSLLTGPGLGLQVNEEVLKEYAAA